MWWQQIIFALYIKKYSKYTTFRHLESSKASPKTFEIFELVWWLRCSVCRCQRYWIQFFLKNLRLDCISICLMKLKWLWKTLLLLNTVILTIAKLDDFSFWKDLNVLELKQTGTLWPCLSSTKLFLFFFSFFLLFPDSCILQCGAEAHSHQVDNASRATVCLTWAGTDKTPYFFVCFFPSHI